MNDDFDNIENAPLSIDNPIDWYYDEVAEQGYATRCIINLFSDYLNQHNLEIKIWGVTFESSHPKVESKDLKIEISESDNGSRYIAVRLKNLMNFQRECTLQIDFDNDFYFSFFEINTDGSISDLDYYDDYCMK